MRHLIICLVAQVFIFIILAGAEEKHSAGFIEFVIAAVLLAFSLLPDKYFQRRADRKKPNETEQ